MSRAFTIGIIAGSGPDAGIDLWQKVLACARAVRGEAYRGDLDAPRVEIVSEPALGASMDLPTTDAEVWPVLAATATALADRCDVYAIACNTLNVYAPRLELLRLPADLLSFPAVAAEWARAEGIDRLALLAAAPVAALGEWSPYRALGGAVTLEPPADPDALHELIEDVKIQGPTEELRARCAAQVRRLDTSDVLLACTELPLIARPVPGYRLVDVTDLVAAALVRRWSAATPG